MRHVFKHDAAASHRGPCSCKESTPPDAATVELDLDICTPAGSRSACLSPTPRYCDVLQSRLSESLGTPRHHSDEPRHFAHQPTAIKNTCLLDLRRNIVRAPGLSEAARGLPVFVGRGSPAPAHIRVFSKALVAHTFCSHTPCIRAHIQASASAPSYPRTCTLTRPSLSSHLLSPQHPPLFLLLSGRADSRPAPTLTNVRAHSQVVSGKML